MNCVKVDYKIVTDCRIEYICAFQGEWKKYFTEEPFYAEYTCPIKNVPASIAVLPALGTLLPISWLFDAEICVDALDADFYNAIPAFKKGYMDMYPQLQFAGKLTVSHIEKNETGGEKCASLFSGGVDAFHTLLGHMEEKPDLLTVWGADVTADNEKGWQKVQEHLDMVAERWALDGIVIRSSLRSVLNDEALSGHTLRTARDNWWHGFQHSLGMFGLSAPIAYVKGYSKIYIASSFTMADKGNYTCASDPTIDNYVRFCGCDIVHDGYECSRQDKIKSICDYAKKTKMQIPLRVCWESTEGANCCVCEKCFRTMLAIYAERANPVDYGFGCKEDNIPALLDRGQKRKFSMNFRYQYIQNRMRENYNLYEVEPCLRWFYKTPVPVLQKRFERIRRIKKLSQKIIRLPIRLLKYRRKKK